MPSNISWTDETWNPVTGCTKVSQGCKHCYAETMAHRFGARYPDGFGTVTRHPDRLEIPLRWKKPRRIFVCSMSDLFHSAVPDSFLGLVFGVMALLPRHTFQVLTKRAQRMAEWSRGVMHYPNGDQSQRPVPGWPPNVRLGVTVEDQATADERIPLLLQTPAAVRFVSYEPALGPVDFTRLTILEPLPPHGPGVWLNALTGHVAGPDDMIAHLDQIIVGGETGPGARPMHPDWPRSVRDQCKAAGVAFHFKQWGEWSRDVVDHSRRIAAVAPDGQWAEGPPQGYGRVWSGAVEVYRVGRKAAGALLDGREWREEPQTSAPILGSVGATIGGEK